MFPQVAVFDVGDTMSDLLNGRTFYAAVTEPVAPATCTETAATSVQADDDACGDAELDLSTDTACHAVQVSVKRLFLFRLPHAARRCFQDRLRTLTDVATASLSTDIVYLVLSCLVLSCLVVQLDGSSDGESPACTYQPAVPATSLVRTTACFLVSLR